MGHVIFRTPMEMHLVKAYQVIITLQQVGFSRTGVYRSPNSGHFNAKIGHVDTISTRTFGNLQLAVFSARHRHGMVKDQKLWREIQLQYAKLREDEVGADLFPPDAGGEGSAGDRCNLERN